MAFEKGDTKIIAYTISDNTDKYKLEINNIFDSIDLEVSHIGYTSIKETNT